LRTSRARPIPSRSTFGNHIVAITGVFNGATLMIERRVPDVHAGDSIKRPDGGPPIPLWLPVLDFSDAGEGQFAVTPNAVGLYRLRVVSSEKLPKIDVVIGCPPVEGA
jgi:hypothetical protein